jgi:hypothetical protein
MIGIYYEGRPTNVNPWCISSLLDLYPWVINENSKIVSSNPKLKLSFVICVIYGIVGPHNRDGPLKCQIILVQ